MKLRELTPEDQEIVTNLHAGSGFDFKFPSLESPFIEAACLVMDATGNPVAVAVAKRAPEVVLAIRKDGHALVKLQALGLVHEYMCSELSARGYSEANCFLPPEIAKNYGRHLRHIFGWQKSWPGYTLRRE